jgi:NOL1/NOP2/fmu family ribosome biogenesis protein
VIERFLEEHPEFELVNIFDQDDATDWGFDFGRDDNGFTARLWAHKLRGEGHFIAKLSKNSGEDTSTELEFEAFTQPFDHKLERKLWTAFCKDYNLSFDNFAVFRGEVQLIAPETPSLETLKVVRAGVPMAEIKSGRLEPHHALSHLLPKGMLDVPVLDLELNDPRIHTFLRGETIQSEGVAAWVVVRVLGLGLAWGKRVGSTIKNHYPKHLRDSRINVED